MHTRYTAIIAPCFNEGGVAVQFVQELESVVAPLPGRFLLIVVDDGSSDDTVQRLQALRTTAANVELRVVELACNVGHQGAIHQGLLYASRTEAERFIVMDSDGEDDPAAIPAMLSASEASIVLVARGKRRESLRFRLGYALYKRLFRIVTKRAITFGNYSMIDRRVLQVVLNRGFVHYAAFLSKQKVVTEMLVLDRRHRFDGRSKMSFQSLSIHAFRSLIEYSEEVLSLFLRAFFLLAIAAVLLSAAIIGTKLFTDEAIPGWASILTVSLLNSTLLCLGFFATGLLLVNSIQRRDQLGRPLFKDPGHG
ncbi:MAG TPA: glycosyltransferase [Flavobacteriales bacterium]